MKKVIILLLLLVAFSGQAFATASITINNVEPKVVKENILSNLALKGHNFRVESVNEYSMVILYVNSVDIGKLIGKNGNMINALKTMANGCKAKDGVSYKIQVVVK